MCSLIQHDATDVESFQVVLMCDHGMLTAGMSSRAVASCCQLDVYFPDVLLDHLIIYTQQRE